MAGKPRPLDKRPAKLAKIDAREIREAILQNSASRRSTQQATKVTVNINQPRGEGGGAKKPTPPKAGAKKSRSVQASERMRKEISGLKQEKRELKEQLGRAQKSADAQRAEAKYWLRERQKLGAEMRKRVESSQPIPPELTERVKAAEARAAAAEAKAARSEQMAQQFGERMQISDEGIYRSQMREEGLRGNLRGVQGQLQRETARRMQAERDMEQIAREGGDTTIIQQQLNEINTNIQQIQQNIELGGGRVRYGPDGMPLIYSPVRGVGGGAGNAALIERLGSMGVKLDEAQLQQILESMGGRGGGEAAENKLMQKVRAWQLAGVNSGDMKKLLFNEEGIKEEKDAKGAKKFAENMESVGKGFGSMANIFNPAMFGNILLIVVLVLMIWIVINMFKFV